MPSADDQWQGWKMLKLTGPQFTSNDACKHDRRLLRNKGILSFTADPNGTTANHGYAILDFDIEDLITAAQDSGDGK